MSLFTNLASEGEPFDHADPGVRRFDLSTLVSAATGAWLPNGPSIYRLPCGRWLLSGKNGALQEIRIKKAMAEFAERRATGYWAWDPGVKVVSQENPSPYRFELDPPQLLLDDYKQFELESSSRGAGPDESISEETGSFPVSKGDRTKAPGERISRRRGEVGSAADPAFENVSIPKEFCLGPMTYDQIAEHFGVCAKTVSNWIRDDKIKVIGSKKHWFVDKREVESRCPTGKIEPLNRK